MVGQQVLHYKIERLIGSGGMGKVFLASHIHLQGRKVAIKILKPELLDDREVRERFKREALVLSELDHPNIVRLIDFVETPQMLALVMEYVEGQPLNDYYETHKNSLSEQNLASIFIEVLEGLAYAHERGIIHRDIKPSNILVCEGKKIKLLDFGIAKLKEHLQHTRTGVQMGTIFYMSPEQVEGKPVDARTDLYALGMSMYHLVTNKLPYTDTRSEYHIYKEIVQESFPPPSHFNPKLSKKLEQIILKAIEKKTSERFLNARAFQQALYGLLQKEKPTSQAGWWVLGVGVIAMIITIAVYILQPKGLFQPVDSSEEKQDTVLVEEGTDTLSTQANESEISDTSAALSSHEAPPIPSYEDQQERKRLEDFFDRLGKLWTQNEPFVRFFSEEVTFDGTTTDRMQAAIELQSFLQKELLRDSLYENLQYQIKIIEASPQKVNEQIQRWVVQTKIHGYQKQENEKNLINEQEVDWEITVPDYLVKKIVTH